MQCAKCYNPSEYSSQMDQHTYVEKCQRFYFVNGLQPGNPDDGAWEDAHYPLPQPEGTETRPLLHSHHLVQGIWQSEEVGRRCFFSGDAKEFLTNGPFVDDWFELWDIYDKWMKIHNENLHSKKDELGRSLLGLENAKRLHADKDELGRSLHALRCCENLHAEKNEEGKSLLAVRVGKTLNQRCRCLTTGFVSTVSGVIRFQKHRGLPPLWERIIEKEAAG